VTSRSRLISFAESIVLQTLHQQKSVLIVEDDPITRTALVSLLSHLGYSTVPVATVAEGLEHLDGQDFAILDMNLPDGLGSTVLQRIRDEHRPMRVAISSGSTDVSVMDDIRNLKAGIILRKPIDVNALIEWLDRDG
jgi:CheY-like chemotaxis protein